MDTKVGHEHKKVQPVLLLSWHLKIEQQLQLASFLLLPWYNSSTAVVLIVTRNSSEIRMMIGAWRLVFRILDGYCVGVSRWISQDFRRRFRYNPNAHFVGSG